MESVTWEILYILISEELSLSLSLCHKRDYYSQDNILPNTISITYIFAVCYHKETEYHYSDKETLGSKYDVVGVFQNELIPRLCREM